jgi:hypothetical protein
MTTSAPIRVFQVATGNVGTEIIKRIATQPNLELIVLHCYITKIQGDPCITSNHSMRPKRGVDIYSPEAVASIGMTITGMPALNAISSVLAAPPGLLTSADIPLRGFAGRFKT